jgi:hypothetical protein
MLCSQFFVTYPVASFSKSNLFKKIITKIIKEIEYKKNIKFTAIASARIHCSPFMKSHASKFWSRKKRGEGGGAKE